MTHHVSRRFSLSRTRYLCGLLVAVAVAAPAVQASDLVAIVADGKAEATVVVPPNDTAAAQSAALLVRYVEQSTGIKLPVTENAPSTDASGSQLHIGPTDYAVSLSLSPEGLDADGFVIAFPRPDRIVMAGGSPKGVEFGVYDFIERYIGVRWLMPGELGEHVPKQSEILVPRIEVRSEPRFISRTLSSYYTDRGTDPWTWLQRMRMHWRVQHHHNVYNLFPASRYFESHPQFYPVIDGERIKPPDGNQAWQPEFDAEGIVETAIDRINAYFDENPAAQSYSLGTNDHHNFGRPGKGTNSVGMPHQSDYYFTFVNAVVAGVLEKHPDKWFGCLAYGPTTDPPREVGVHPRMMPHICYDRMTWYDPHWREVDQQRTIEWQQYAPTLGWYDYVYGDDQYRIPRIYPHLMAETLRFAADHGVKAYYAEAYITPAWTEGPKFYLLMKLLWDPTLDVSEMLDEWYTLAVGEAAAPYLAQYYEVWETIWKERIPKTDWFQQGAKEIYLRFDKHEYLDVMTDDDFKQSAELLNQVVSLAGTPEQQARARFIRTGFAAVRKDVQDYLRLKRMKLTPAMRQTVILDEHFTPGGAVGSEGLPAGWSTWQWETSRAKFSWISDFGRADAGSLRVDAAGAEGHVALNRYVSNCAPETIYRVHGYVRFEGLNETARPALVVSWRDSKGEWMSRTTTSSYILNDTSEGVWHPMELFVRAPRSDAPVTMVLALMVQDVTRGTIHFDDVQLVKIKST